MHFLPLYDENPRYGFPLVTVSLIILNLIMYPQGVEYFKNACITFNPMLLEDYGNILVYMFYHASLLHLLSNMLFLYIFGDNIEDILGKKRFLMLYLSSGFIGGLVQSTITCGIGASAAVAGILAAYIIIFPTKDVNIYISYLSIVYFLTRKKFFFRIKAWHLITVWLLTQFLSVLLMPGELRGVGYFSHIFGFVGGFTLTTFYGRSLDFDQRKKRVQELIGIRKKRDYSKKIEEQKNELQDYVEAIETQQKRFEILEYRIVGQRIQELLTWDEPLTAEEITKRIGLEEKTITRELNKMLEKKIIKKNKYPPTEVGGIHV